MRSKTELLTILLAGASLALAGGCGDDDGNDGSDVVDSGPDDQFDAMQAPEFSGQALFFDVSVPAFPEVGNGPIIQIDFNSFAATVAPAWEEAPGSPFGCKAWDYSAAEFLDQHLDQGTFEFTTPEDYAQIPPCNFVPGVGWACIGAMGGGGDIAVVDAGMGLFSLTDTNITFGPDQVGRLVHLEGTTNLSNSGDFPVVAAEGDNTIIFQNPIPGADEETDTPGTYITLSGLGPAGSTFPIDEDASIGFKLTSGGEGDVASFDRPVEMAKEFTIDTESEALLSDVPMDGSEFTFSCQGEGGDCGTSLSTVLSIVTTDGNIEGLPPYILPPPQEKVAVIQCTVLAGSATVMAAGSQVLADSGATRVRAVFLRANAVQPLVPNTALTLVAGRGVAGFTDP
jgi:hypothetical protein